MKRVFIAVLAAFVMSLGFVGCSSSPADKMISVTKDMLSILKSTEIKSEQDVKDLAAKFEDLKKEAQEIEKAMEEETKNMSDEEKLSYVADMMKTMSEVGDLEKEMKTEIKRLEKEAKAAGVNLDGIDL